MNEARSNSSGRLEAITGFVAIVVLLVVLNWFVHKVYWSEWIGRHHRQRQRRSAHQFRTKNALARQAEAKRREVAF